MPNELKRSPHIHAVVQDISARGKASNRSPSSSVKFSKTMKRSLLALLLPLGALSSCESMHNAAVSTFRVVDAPHQYLRRELGMNEDDQPQTTTATTTTTEATYPAQENSPPPPQTPTAQTQSYNSAPPPPVKAAPPPVQAPRTVASTQQREVQATTTTRELAGPTATPHVVARETASRTAESHPTATPRISSTPHTISSKASATSELPYAKPVPGKSGYVFSPFDPNGGYVDVTGYSPGQKVKDPYSGKIFLVP